MSRVEGRWTRQPPPGSNPVCVFIFIPKLLAEFLEHNKQVIQERQVTRVPSRVAQRITGPDGALWMVAGSAVLWNEAQLKLNRALWWSKTIDVQFLSIDPGAPPSEDAPDVR